MRGRYRGGSDCACERSMKGDCSTPAQLGPPADREDAMTLSDGPRNPEEAEGGLMLKRPGRGRPTFVRVCAWLVDTGS
jgi:hypothetical protein